MLQLFHSVTSDLTTFLLAVAAVLGGIAAVLTAWAKVSKRKEVTTHTPKQETSPIFQLNNCAVMITASYSPLPAGEVEEQSERDPDSE
jgi:hypothetical protein